MVRLPGGYGKRLARAVLHPGSHIPGAGNAAGPGVVALVMLFSRHKTEMVDPEHALPGRPEPMPVPGAHFVNGHALTPPFPEGLATAVFGLGCFWGAERQVLARPRGVDDRGRLRRRLHAQPHLRGGLLRAAPATPRSVLVVFDPAVVSYDAAAQAVLGGARPDPGHAAGQRRRDPVPLGHRLGRRRPAPGGRGVPQGAYQAELAEAGYGAITTEIAPAGPFYYAEDYHQQYLAKNPGGYCGHGGTGVTCPVGLTAD